MALSDRATPFPLAAGRTGGSPPQGGRGSTPTASPPSPGVYPSVAAGHLPFARGGVGWRYRIGPRPSPWPQAAQGEVPRRGEGGQHPPHRRHRPGSTPPSLRATSPSQGEDLDGAIGSGHALPPGRRPHRGKSPAGGKGVNTHRIAAIARGLPLRPCGPPPLRKGRSWMALSDRATPFPLAAGRTGGSPPQGGRGSTPAASPPSPGVYPSGPAGHLPFARGGSGWRYRIGPRPSPWPQAAQGEVPRRGEGGQHPPHRRHHPGLPLRPCGPPPLRKGRSWMALSDRATPFPLAAGRTGGRSPKGGRGSTPAASPPSPGVYPSGPAGHLPFARGGVAGFWLRASGCGLLADG